MNRALPLVTLLAALALSTSACTQILGSFDFDGAGGTSSSTTTTGAGGTTSTGPAGGGGTGGTGETGGTGGTGGAECTAGGVSCSVPEDCPDTGNDCIARTCKGGCCGTEPVADNMPASDAAQTAGDCKLVVCDGAGSTKVVNDDMDFTDSGNPCLKDGCAAGTPVSTPQAGTCGPSGTQWCGAPSGPKAGQCVDCNVDTDCASSVCIANTCAAATCGDGVKNGSETGVDCGGGCTGCADGAACANGDDCASKVCDVAGTARRRRAPTTRRTAARPTSTAAAQLHAVRRRHRVRRGRRLHERRVHGRHLPGADLHRRREERRRDRRRLRRRVLDQCADGQGCAIAGDCTSGVCTGGTCCEAPPAATA